MATTDHGELLTKFEEIFGSVVEHEVIKMVLQSCDWNSSSANEMILSMIDPDTLPPHVRCAVTADAVIRGGNVHLPDSPPLSDSERMSSRSPEDRNQEELLDIDEDDINFPILNAQSRSDSPPLSFALPPDPHSGTSRTNHDPGPPLRSYSQNSTLTPFAMAQGSSALDTARWVLAPEFVPNALHPNSNRIIPISPESSQPFVVSAVQKMDDKNIKKSKIIRIIQNGIKIMILMRGLPGSGKSSLAREIKGCSGVVLSTDDYFIDKKGRYVYDPSKISEAHSWNRNRARKMLREMKSPIIIDNTNLQAWEMKPYVQLALHNGYEIDILEPETPWRYNVKELAKKNSHGVPKEKIKEMLERYEKHIKIEDIIASVSDIKLTNGNGNSPSKSEESLKSQTDWPETLPGISGNIGVTEFDLPTTDPETNRVENRCLDGVDANSPMHSSGMALKDERDEKTNAEILGNATSHLQNEECRASDTDDADVVIESLEDINSNFSAIAIKSVMGNESQDDTENFKITSKQSSAVIESMKEKVETNDGHHILVTENSVNSPEFFIGDKTDSHAKDLLEEEKIRLLLEEANMDTDDCADDWDDLLKNVCEEELNDEQFNELVQDLGTSVRSELDKRTNGICASDVTVDISDKGEYADDSAMYELCSNMEDKLGRSLSSVITRPSGSDEPSSLFSIINVENSVIDSEINRIDKNDDISVASELKTTEVCEVFSDKNDNVINEIDEKPFTPSVIAEKSDDSSSKMTLEDKISECNSKSGIVQSVIETNTEDQPPVSADQNAKETITLSSSSIVDKTFDSTRIDDSMDPCQSSLTSWDCIDLKEGENVASWGHTEENVNDSDRTLPKPTRDRKRASGDPQKWMAFNHESEADDQNSCSWEPVSEGVVASWENTDTNNGASEVRKSQSHTGAVPKVRKQEMKHNTSVTSSRSSDSPSPKLGEHHKFGSPIVSKSLYTNVNRSTIDKNIISVKQTSESETQTLSIDFQALEMDNNLYELKILYGQPGYIPMDVSETMSLDNGPLTRGKLSLDKGTMTESLNDITVVKPLRNLIAFFPKIPEPHLRDVLEKCKFDLDWAMNVLLDGGYEMADSVEVCSQESSDEFDDVENIVEDTNTNNNASERLLELDAKEAAVVLPSEERNKRLKQSQTTESLASKKEIENSFLMPESVDDRVTRLTGKEFEELNLHKVKQKKTKKKHSKKKHSETKRESINWEEGEGAQYLTLTMDSLFASQLMSMFGPIGSCGMSGEMEPEDRNVILPLELCHEIHKYWTKTLDGKFKHEGEVLDSLIREDENLARRLQEEENRASENVDFSENANSMDNSDKVFLLDPPKNLQEIMDLEQALWESQNDKSNGNGTLISSQLSLQRLCAEYPHVDPEAVKHEFKESGCSYQVAVNRISSRYGNEPGVPKTVMAPEYIQLYEQQLLREKEASTSHQEPEEEDYQPDEEIEPDDPQMYRDEAQMHYHQRQEFYKKAQIAYREGMKNVAAYYAAIGKLHAEKLNEANRRASFKILEAVNSKNKKDANFLDLHLLHVPEALSATKAFLLEREQLLLARNISSMNVHLITGRGAHSLGGQAKVKPAIRDYLQKKGYSFHEGNSGMFVVNLKR